MDNHVYKTVEITGTSSDTLESAIQNAINRSSHSIRNMRWFQVAEIRGAIDNANVKQWQVTVKISFDVEE